MVALTGPSSTTSRQMSAMKRPSDVPPVHESSGVDAARRLDGLADDLDEPAARGEEGLAPARPLDFVVEAVLAQDRPRSAAAGLRGVLVVAWRKLNSSSSVPGNDVGGAGAGVDVRRLPGGRRKVFVAVVPVHRLPVRRSRARRDGSGLRARCGYAMWPCTPRTISVPDSVPRRPFLIMSPSRSTDDGSPMMQ